MVEYLQSDAFLNDFFNQERRAQSALFEAYFVKLRVFATAIIKNSDEAEDIVIRCLTRVLTEPERFQRGKFEVKQIVAYLFTSVRNRCIDHQRSRATKVITRLVEEDKTIQCPNSDIEMAIVELEVVAALYEGLKGLHPLKRRTLELLYYEGLTYKEAARILGVSVYTLKIYRRFGLSYIRSRVLGKQAVGTLGLIAVYFGQYFLL